MPATPRCAWANGISTHPRAFFRCAMVSTTTSASVFERHEQGDQPRAEWAGRTPPTPLIRGERTIEQEPDQSTLTRRYTGAGHGVYPQEQRRREAVLPLHASHLSTLAVAASERFRGRSLAGLFGDAVEEIDWERR